MAKRRRQWTKFTPEQRAQAVQAYLSSGQSMYAAAKQLGIAYNNLHRWIRQYREQVQSKVTPLRAEVPQTAPLTSSVPEATHTAITSALNEELESLRRTNQTLARELTICKNALAFYAEELFLHTTETAA